MKRNKILSMVVIGGLLFLLAAPIQADDIFLRRNMSSINGMQSAISGELTPVNQPEAVWVGLIDFENGVPSTECAGYVHLLVNDSIGETPYVYVQTFQGESRSIHPAYVIRKSISFYDFETRMWFEEHSSNFGVNANRTFPRFENPGGLRADEASIHEDMYGLYRIKAAVLTPTGIEITNSTKTGLFFFDFPPFTNDASGALVLQ